LRLERQQQQSNVLLSINGQFTPHWIFALNARNFEIFIYSKIRGASENFETYRIFYLSPELAVFVKFLKIYLVAFNVFKAVMTTYKAQGDE
jgi:hypothetical protein